MLTKRWIGPVLWMLLTLPGAVAQTDIPAYLEELVAGLSETVGENPDPEEVAELSWSPGLINLNQASSDDLLAIPGLTARQVSALSRYLISYGEVFSWYELQAVEGFDSAIIRRIIPYLYLGPVKDPAGFSCRNLLKLGKHELLFRFQQQLQQRAGFRIPESGDGEAVAVYPGSPQGYLFRYRYSFRQKLIIGFSGEKDPGELFFRGAQTNGFDFYSGFLTLNNLGWLKNLTIGHFRCSFGQGLTLGGGAFGNTPGLSGTLMYTSGFRPSQSTSEYGFFRGLACTVETGRVTWSGFVSYTFRDANLIEDETLSGSQPVFTSFSTTGYHRTTRELEGKRTVPELVYGGGVRFRGNFFQLGVTGYAGRWFGSYQPEEEVYRRFLLTGQRYGAAGVDGRVRFACSQVFGEFSVTLNGATAWLCGLTVTPFSGFDLLAIARNYRRDYANPLSSAIAQHSDRTNERGIFVRISFPLFNRLQLTGYADLYQNPWVRYQTDGLSAGFESGIQPSWEINPFWNINLRYLYREGQQNGPAGSFPVRSLISIHTHDIRFQTILKPLTGLRLNSMAGIRIAGGESAASPGFQISQEVRYQCGRNPLTFTMRYTLFDCPDYTTRIYMYEPDVLFSYSVPAYYGKGIGCIFLISKQFGRWLDLWVRLSWLHYTDRDHTGSGPDEIRGSDNSLVRIQCLISL